MLREHFKRSTVHLVFGAAIFLALLFGVVTRMSFGERFFQALGNSIKQGRPMEWLMVFLLWYAAAFPQRFNGATGGNLILGLSGRK